MKTSEIRSAFLDYFASQQHSIVESSSLIPANDPTLLFTNAGMVQFKDLFLGREQRSYQRAASSQRCVRAGGKHNDLENVGYTARHHTFFEMLGNFSFGDYFKREAIKFAWEFLTQTLKLPEEKLWVTVFHEDAEAEAIWLEEMGVSAARFSRLGEKDNFWQMGDTGPCGPCSEIFYDHGDQVWGGPPGSPEEDGDRYIEIWNLVFMQFDRQPDGELIPLPKPSVDTGMGLERIAAVMQGVHSNYEIDLFQQLLAATQQATGCSDASAQSLRVIADHIRSCSFLIADGVLPSNEGRGYVLRRIIRRAIRHGHKLGCQQAFFYKLVPALIAEMGTAYPELRTAQANIEKALLREEEQFLKTLDSGMKILEQGLEGLPTKEVPGELVFKLYDTHGFPADLTADIARERDLGIDQQGFDALMAQQKAQSRQSGNFGGDYHSGIASEVATRFTGYDTLLGEARIAEIFVDAEPCEQLTANQEAVLILDSSPFYAEAGGQVGDTGFIETAAARFQVTNTTKDRAAFLHHGKLCQGQLSQGEQVSLHIDADKRHAIRLHHSTTHLMHAALRQVLGDHVVQKGSQVSAERLRFDFAHFEPITAEQMTQIEVLVNQQIRANTPITTEVMDIEAAKAKGAMALFGEKYDQQVRVLSMGTDNFSIELCGGTHASRTGDMGFFKILAESGIAAGVRRIEAVCGAVAMDWLVANEARTRQLEYLLKAGSDQLVAKTEQLLSKNKQLEKDLKRQQEKLASSAGSDLADNAVEVAGIKLLAAKVEGVEPKALRDMVDRLKNKLGSGVIVLGLVNADKVNLIAGVTKDLTQQVKAGELINHVATQVGGKGGGRPDMAQAGGSQPEHLDAALASVSDWVADKRST